MQDRLAHPRQLLLGLAMRSLSFCNAAALREWRVKVYPYVQVGPAPPVAEHALAETRVTQTLEDILRHFLGSH